MRQRISVEQLKEPTTERQIQDALLSAERAVADLTLLAPSWLAFCNEKLSLANESLVFLLKQRFQLFRKGFPSRNIEYLRLIERQIGELRAVYESFYRLKPGLIHQLKSEQNEIYVWLMLQNEFNQIEQNLLCGLATIDELPSDFAKYIVIQSPILSLDHTLASLIEGGSKLRGHYFDFLVLRQSLTVGLIKRWLKAEQISNESGHCALARQNVAEGIEWINANGYGEQYLFERLLTKYDRGTWFRQYFGTEQNSIAHDNVATFAKLLELKEFSAFDVTLTDAPFHFSLSGDSKLASVVLDYLSDLDEFEGEIWIKALYVVYGATLPVSPAQVGIELNWQEILELLKKWREREGHIQKLPSRLGYELTFESSISAMMDRNIDAQFRGWIWKQICLYSRSYIQWDEMMPIHQQEWNIERLKSAPSAAERFNLRGNHAVVGY